MDEFPKAVTAAPPTAEEPEDRLLNLRGALSERARLAIREAGSYTDQRAFTSGFLAGLEHARLVCDLLETAELDIREALVEEEKEFREEFDR